MAASQAARGMKFQQDLCFISCFKTKQRELLFNSPLLSLWAQWILVLVKSERQLDTYCRLKASTVQVPHKHSSAKHSLTPTLRHILLQQFCLPHFPSPVLPSLYCCDFNIFFNIVGWYAPLLGTEIYAELHSRFCEGSRAKPSEFVVTFGQNWTRNFSFQMR